MYIKYGEAKKQRRLDEGEKLRMSGKEKSETGKI